MRCSLAVLITILAFALAAPARAHDEKAPPPLGFGGPFALVDQDGRPRTERDFAGRYLLIYFGYTNCPAVCPTGLDAIAGAMEALGAAAARVQPLFITVDPARDTPAVLKDYVAGFHPRLIGLTGGEAEIAAALRAWRVPRYKVVPDDMKGSAGYLVEHGPTTFLMGPDGEWLTLFPHAADPDAMAAAIRTYLR